MATTSHRCGAAEPVVARLKTASLLHGGCKPAEASVAAQRAADPEGHHKGRFEVVARGRRLAALSQRAQPPRGPRPTRPGGGERREEVTFVDVTVWGRQAEVAQQYLAKGRAVFIEGRLQLDTWDDKQSGQKRSKIKVVCEHLQLLGGRGAGEGGPSETGSRPPAQRGKGAPAPRPQPARDPDLDAEPDDIPF